jgi:transmembrane sensor
LTKEKEIPELEEYFQNEDSNSEWLEKLFEEEKNEPDLERNLRVKWFDILKTSTPQIDLKHILYKIHFNINSEERSLSASKIRQLYNRVSKIAVILLLPLLALSIYLMVNMFQKPLQVSEIVAPKGEKAQFILPDGSSGYLNSGSTLKYSYPFNNNRFVELTGEGYFNIVNDEDPFAVQAHNMKVVVHGTRFNVCAYNDDAEVITTLEEGRVSVIRNVDGKSMIIKPGQQAIFNKSNNQIAKKRVDIDLYVSWKDNMLRFNDAPFADVVKKMERWYDVKIILDKDLQYTQRYTMTIKTESLREMFDLMIITTPMKYKIKEDIVYITHKN